MLNELDFGFFWRKPGDSRRLIWLAVCCFPHVQISPGNYLLMPKHLTLNHECKLFGFCKKRPAGFYHQHLTCYKREAGRYPGKSGVIENMAAQLSTTQRYATILEVNRAAITELGIPDIFRGTCDALKKRLPYDRMGLSLYAPRDRALKLAAAYGCTPDSFYHPGLILDCKESHHGWVFQNKTAIVRRDLQKELQFQVEQHNVREGIRSYCAVPLVVRGESLGVVIILSSQKNCYSAEHADFLQEVSNQPALALKSLMPSCPKHPQGNLICPRCIAGDGGRSTAARHKERSEEHTSELQSRQYLVCRLLLEKKKKKKNRNTKLLYENSQTYSTHHSEFR